MYEVSSQFLDAIQGNTRHYYWSGSITTRNGSTYHFNNKDIVKGSACISHQCCSSEIEIGTVYSAELCIALYLDLNRYILDGGLVRLYFNLNVEPDKYETIPLGIFEISEANRMAKCLEIKAYDYMLRFDKQFKGWFTTGTACDLLAMACKECKVELKHSKEELESMPNGKFILSIYPENDIETWRDVLFYVAQVLGSFAVINRDGRLELRQYGKESVLTITNKQRFTSSFSDFITRYTAVSSTNIRTATAEYYALDVDDGLTMNLGVNPLLQYVTASARNELINNILYDLTEIQYVPFQMDTIGNPALDLGDVLSFAGGQADRSNISCVTAYSMKLNGKQQLKCVGKNPRLSQAKSKNDKNIAGLLSQIEASKVTVQTFKNASDYLIREADTEMIKIEFITVQDTTAQFNASVLLEIQVEQNKETSGVASDFSLQEREGIPLEEGTARGMVIFEWNGERIETFQPMQVWRSGSQILSLYYPFIGLEGSKANQFKVFLRMVGGQAFIRQGGIVAGIYGQGIVRSEAGEWDGYIRLEDEVSLIETGFTCLKLQDAPITRKLQVENVHSLRDSITIQRSGFTVLDIRETNREIYLWGENGTDVYDTTGKLFLGFELLHVKEICTGRMDAE